MAQTVGPRVAVIGAGWAGLACAVELCAVGIDVSIFDSNAIAGGRARKVVLSDGRTLDNGQHLMLGAYHETLRMIGKVNTTPRERLFTRKPLTLVNASTYGATPEIALHKPAIPVVDGGLMLARAVGLTWRERLQLVRYFARIVLFPSHELTRTVAQDLVQMSATIRDRVLGPLCLAALNTPIERASAVVFQNVLRACFKGGHRSADMLIPNVDLSALFPDPALDYLRAGGAGVHLGETVFSLETDAHSVKIVTRRAAYDFDQCVVATAPQTTRRLLAPCPSAQPTVNALESLSYEPITTYYRTHKAAATVHGDALSSLFCVNDSRLQWVVRQPQRKLESIVVSGREANADDDQRERAKEIARLIGCSLDALTPITEKRATYSCSPQNHARLATLPVPPPPIWLAGDYRYPQFPATIESAVRSGVRTANDIIHLSKKQTYQTIKGEHRVRKIHATGGTFF